MLSSEAWREVSELEMLALFQANKRPILAGLRPLAG
jgi:hypothetical protein